MITYNVKIHDRYSFEAKLNFLSGKNKEKFDVFQADMYLFAPYNLDISPQNYKRNDFYKALKLNIRHAGPIVDFYKLSTGKESPFRLLKSKIEAAVSSPDTATEEAQLFTKRYCSVFRSSLRREIFKITKIKEENELKKACEQLVKQTEKTRKKFGELCESVSAKNNKKLKKVLQLADEYQSLTVEEHFSIFISIIRKKSYGVEAAEIVKKTLFKELEYRLSKKYPSVGDKKIKGEEVLHRKSRLKKYIESNLFLNIETKKDGVLLEQILFSLAAGMAMIFSTGVAFASQKTYGNFTLPFFIALVISYMFKDRIKEIMRVYFDKKQRKLHHDYKTVVYGQNRHKMGIVKESFRFEKKRHVPDVILDRREKMRTTEIGEIFQSDSILVYRNLVKVKNKENNKELPSPGLTEIIRFNINDFTLKMDDSEKWIFVKTKNGWKKTTADRVYYINLIFRFQYGDQSEYACFKLSANRNGIKRMKKISV